MTAERRENEEGNESGERRGSPGSTRPAVLLFKGRGLISTAIRWQTRSVYSHAALLRPDGRIIESWQGAGVRLKRLEDWRDVDVFDVPSMSPEQWRVALDYAALYLGSGYDYKAVLRFVSRRPAADDDRWFCSELVFAALQEAGVNLLERVGASQVSPGMLAWSPLLVPRKEGGHE